MQAESKSDFGSQPWSAEELVLFVLTSICWLPGRCLCVSRPLGLTHLLVVRRFDAYPPSAPLPLRTCAPCFLSR